MKKFVISYLSIVICQSLSAGVQMRLYALLAAMICGGFIQQAHASNGESVQVPLMTTFAGKQMPAFSKQSGLQVQVDSTWVGNRGYRPVSVTVTTAKPTTADTLITINFSAGSWRSSSRAIRVESDLKLTQGSTSCTSTFFVPQYVDWNYFGWEVWVDGVKDDELCLDQVGFNAGNSGMIAAGSFQIDDQWTAMKSTAILQEASNDSIDMQAFDIASLPDRWIDYSSLDALITTVKSLEVARISSPEKLTALLRWVRAGGNLLVTEVGKDYSELTKLDRILGLDRILDRILDTDAEKDRILDIDAEKQSTKEVASAEPWGHWRFLKYSQEGQTRLKNTIRLSMEGAMAESTLTPIEFQDGKRPDHAIDTRQWFVAQAYGLGTLLAIQESGSIKLNSAELSAAALNRSSISENLDWATRHGNNPATGNPSFNNLLIPDVGAAPVFEFQMLISLFVIAIGPVNYWLLKRRNQLPLLLVTVPFAAMVTTAILFTYGFLADGTGVRVRARTITMLDQQSGEMASWARLSYYAGIAPSDGLRMPTDTVVYPIHPSRSQTSNFGNRHINQQRALEWGKQQQLTRGWLGSRTPTQYLALTARATKKHLLLEAQSDQFLVTNHLGVDVLALVVQDQDGKIFTCDRIEAKGSGTLEPSTYIQAASKIRTHLAKNTPQLPAAFIQGNRIQGNRSQGNRWQSNEYGVPTSTSLMELQFEAIVSPLAVGWGKGTYVAVTASGIEVPLGIDDVTESSSFHLVRGTW